MRGRIWRTGLFPALFSIFVWGASFAVTRAAVREIPPMALAFLRFALATAVLWPAARRTRVRIEAADRTAVFALGLFGVTFYFVFENFGLTHTTASHAALIVATIPLTTELAAARRDHRRPAVRVIAGLLPALAGVALIFGRGAGGATLQGDLLMLGAVACWVGYTLVADRLTGRYPGPFLTWRIMAVGAVTLLPAGLVEAVFIPFGNPSAPAWAGVAFLGVFCSALAYLAWNQALPVLGVRRTSSLINLIPLVGVLTGILALGEPLTLRIVIGGGLIIGGVVWAGNKL
jgi:drug/metabolite transporter (DMT)-like permease